MDASTPTEDPIAGLFELADRVTEVAPRIRRMFLYTAVVIMGFLAIVVFLLFVALRADLLFLGLALGAVVLGATSLVLLSETDRFYRTLSERHRRLKLLQFADPAPKIPPGRTSVRRLARYLAVTNPRVASLLAEHPEALKIRSRAGPDGASTEVAFSIASPAGRPYRWLRLGDPGFVVIARVGPEQPSVSDLERFGREATAVAGKIGGRLARAILLRPAARSLERDAYDYSVRQPLSIPGGPPVAVEVVSERPDGTYDLVPHVIGIP